MKKIQSIYSVFLIVFMVILVSLPLYWVSNKIMKIIIFHLYLIPVIFCAFRFGLKGAVLVTIVSTLIYAPDYMLFWGTLSDDMIEAYARISIFTLVALLFGFFLDRWRNEKKKLAATNQRLVEMNEDLKELMVLKETLEKQERLAALGTVSSGISHELKNPLSIIKTAIATMTAEALNLPEIKEVKAVIEEEIQRADGIINSVLSIARESDIIFENFYFDKMVAGVLRLLKENFSKKRCDIINEMTEFVETTGDEQKLSRVVFNLLINAADAVEQAGGGWIKLKLFYQENNLIFSVEDSGGGIQPEKPDIIFTPFFTTKAKGTGLGLSISRNIVEEHSGIIECENTKAGAKFTVKIPLPISKED